MWLQLIQYEAARTICGLPKMADRDDLLSSAVTVLAHNLSSTKPTLRFASVRTLNKVVLVLVACVCHIWSMFVPGGMGEEPPDYSV